MPRYTNNHGLPDPLYQLLGRESYSRGKSRRSATQLIDSPRLVALKEKHGGAPVVDISERVWSLFGTAVHKLIEDGLPHSSWHLAEERIFTEVNGWPISGAVDLQEVGILATDNSKIVGLVDWKVCSIWSVYSGGKPKIKVEWENQLNLLAYLIEREKGHNVTGLQIGALLRDWKQAEADRDPSYPRAPFIMVDIPLWSCQDREAYVHERVRLHQEAEIAVQLDDEPPPCTDEEMWVRDNAWAVMKPGNKRATKVFDNPEDAQKLSDTIPTSAVEFRPGERLRCARYCEAAAFCSIALASKSGNADGKDTTASDT